MKTLPEVGEKASFRDYDDQSWSIRYYFGMFQGYYMASIVKDGVPLPWKQMKCIEEEPKKIRQPVFGDWIIQLSSDGTRLQNVQFSHFDENGNLMTAYSDGSGARALKHWCWPDDAEDKPEVEKAKEYYMFNKVDLCSALTQNEENTLIMLEAKVKAYRNEIDDSSCEHVRVIEEPTPTREPERLWHNRQGGHTGTSGYRTPEQAKDYIEDGIPTDQIEFVEVMK